MFSFTFENNSGFDFSFDNPSWSFDFTERISTPPYEGDYEVTSLPFQDQLYETKGYRMRDDLTVKAIPYEEVSNPQGGKTVTIGGY